uniref:EFR1 family ferrodoxin n=1 Tax=uncultured Megasphaera sp. TaxID=165188 RepID=UPI0025888D72|nr:EFR1 family ferrodoxin [uncultured Megasphaera sp.]
MTIDNVTAVYFSPTGNTEKMCTQIAQELAKKLRVPCRHVNFTLPTSRTRRHVFAGTSLVVFAMPTYAGRLPNKLVPFVQKNFQGLQSPAITLVTFGNRSADSALPELAQTLAQNGFYVIAGASLAAPHVFSPRIGNTRPDAADMRLQEDFIRALANKLRPQLPLAEVPRPSLLSAPIAPYYTPLGIDGKPAKFLKAKPQTNLPACTRCLRCVNACPMGSINPEDPSQVPGICIKCHACIHICPHHAKYFADTAFLSHVAMLEQNYTRRAKNHYYL